MSDLASDYLGLDGLLSAEEIALRDRVRGFVDERIRPHIARWYEDAHFPRELVPELGALGVLGMHLRGHGCAGRSAVEYGLAAMELEAGDMVLEIQEGVLVALHTGRLKDEGTDEVHTLIMGRAITGIPAFEAVQ